MQAELEEIPRHHIGAGGGRAAGAEAGAERLQQHLGEEVVGRARGERGERGHRRRGDARHQARASAASMTPACDRPVTTTP